ncbi:MAG: glycosyltransferase [Phycisphaerae bacterium]
MRVAVCVITCRRPEGLARLLEGLNRLEFTGQEPEIRCLVVDNESRGQAGQVCERLKAGYRWVLECYEEPRRGIPFARNTAVARAGADVDCIAFIDDDEVPEPNWLDELLRVMQQYDADVTAGPVLSDFEEPPPEWAVRGRFYDRARFPTGTVRDRAFTGNILFRRRVFDAMDRHFDESMALIGGSDSHFLQRVHRAGFKIVWADEAVATESVPASRVSAGWLLRRSFRYGATTAYILFDLRSRPMAVALLLLNGVNRVVRGAALLLVTGLFGRHRRISSLRHIWYGSGLLAGLFGKYHHEYEKTHGS